MTNTIRNLSGRKSCMKRNSPSPGISLRRLLYEAFIRGFYTRLLYEAFILL